MAAAMVQTMFHFSLSHVGVLLLALAIAFYVARFGNSKKSELPRDKVKSFALKVDFARTAATSTNDLNDSPLLNTVAIVTGATSGLGKELAAELYLMGCTVIVASRSVGKVNKVISEIKDVHKTAKGTLLAGEVDTSDLASVQKFVDTFTKKHKKLHFLINNAGIHYASSEGMPLVNYGVKTESSQGFDSAFATNYLGHFLLTKLLLPTMYKSGPGCRVLNVASSYHFQSDGTMLMPQSEHNNMPEAARSDVLTFRHRRLSYGNNKLAQVLHAKELQRRLGGNGSNVVFFSVCPGWVDTNILPDNAGGRFVAARAFSPSAGILSPLAAMLAPNLHGGNFISISHNFWVSQSWSKSLFSVITKLGIRPGMCDTLALWVLFFQHSTYGIYEEPSSPESEDKVLAAALYDWSERAVQPFVRK